MKKVLVFLIVIGGIGSAVFFYDPYLKPFLGPVLGKITGAKSESLVPGPESVVPTTSAAGPGQADERTKPAGVPASPAAAPMPAKDKLKIEADPAPTSAPPAKSEIDRLVEERYPIPQFVPLAQIVNNWTNVPPRAFPDQVAILEGIPIVLRDPAGNKIGESVAPPGTLMKTVALNGQTLTIANIANPAIRNEIALDKTDFKARVQKRYDDFIAQMNGRILAQREKAKQALLAKPEALAALSGGGGTITLGPNDDPRIAPAKASLAQGKVTSFTLPEAVGFRWNGSERINGEKFRGVYETVTVRYEAKTIFGTFPGEAKCLIQAGRVIGWIDPITEDELI